MQWYGSDKIKDLIKPSDYEKYVELGNPKSGKSHAGALVVIGGSAVDRERIFFIQSWGLGVARHMFLFFYSTTSDSASRCSHCNLFVDNLCSQQHTY